MDPRPDGDDRLPAGVVVLGLVSLFMDLSSEMIHATLPLFLVAVLGVDMASVGLIEGVAEATASISKLAGGIASDRLGRRKPLVLAGYGLAAATKPLFAIAGSAATVVAARFVDRVGKGIRGAPRDALVAEITPPGARGAAFGLRQSLDTVGAVLGPAVAMAVLALSPGAYRVVFAIAVLPALVSVALIVLGVDEPPAAVSGDGAAQDGASAPAGAARPLLRRADLADLGARYWLVLALSTVLTLARFSEAFLLLRAADAGLPAAAAPLALVAMNVVYAASAWPLGRLSDAGRARVLVPGIALLVAADVVLALASGPGAVLLGAALWGLHMGATQGLFSAIVAESAPASVRASAFGLFHLVTGVALLAASAIAGAAWSAAGPRATFGAGAVLASIAMAGLLLRGRVAPAPRPAPARDDTR